MSKAQWLSGGVATLVVIVVSLLFFYMLQSQYSFYDKLWAFDEVKKSPVAAIALARAYEFSSAKIISIFLSFIMIISGSLYILNASDTVFQASADIKDKGSAAVYATSPGLIIAFLGTILACVAIYNKTDLHAISTISSPDLGGSHDIVAPIAQQK